jgi:hypothetical protein
MWWWWYVENKMQQGFFVCTQEKDTEAFRRKMPLFFAGTFAKRLQIVYVFRHFSISPPNAIFSVATLEKCLYTISN